MKRVAFIKRPVCRLVLATFGFAFSGFSQPSDAVRPGDTNAVWSPLIMHPVKDAATVEMLRAAVKESDPVVRERAEEALAVIRGRAGGRSPQRVVTTIMPAALRSTNVLTLVHVLRGLDAEASRREAAAVIALLRRPEAFVQEEAVRAIQSGQFAAAGNELIALLNDSDEGLRRVACETLAMMFDRLARPELTAAMVKRLEADPSSKVRDTAGLTLVALRDAPAQEALLRLLKHERGVTRVSAAEALGMWGDAKLAGALHPLLNDPADLVARAAAAALGLLRNPDSKGPLLAAFEARGPVVQERAAWALGELKSTNAVPALIARLGTTDEALKVSLVLALGKTGDKRALPPIRQVLQQIVLANNLPKAREAAFTVLTTAGDKVAIPRAIQIVTTTVVPPAPGGGPTYDDDFVRIAALRYLADVGDRTVGTTLLTTIKDGPPREIRLAVAETLSKLLGQNYQPIPDEDYRRYFIESLAPRPFKAVPSPGAVLSP